MSGRGELFWIPEPYTEEWRFLVLLASTVYAGGPAGAQWADENMDAALRAVRDAIVNSASPAPVNKPAP